MATLSPVFTNQLSQPSLEEVQPASQPLLLPPKKMVATLVPMQSLTAPLLLGQMKPCTVGNGTWLSSRLPQGWMVQLRAGRGGGAYISGVKIWPERGLRQDWYITPLCLLPSMDCPVGDEFHVTQWPAGFPSSVRHLLCLHSVPCHRVPLPSPSCPGMTFLNKASVLLLCWLFPRETRAELVCL